MAILLPALSSVVYAALSHHGSSYDSGIISHLASLIVVFLTRVRNKDVTLYSL